MPDKSQYRYTEEHPYISPGLTRETKKGQAYVTYEADLAEFNDTYMRDFNYSPNGVNKMSVGLDERINFSVNVSRKNYLDYFPEKPSPKDVKIVGNTLKSKKLSVFISKFLEKGVRYLLQNNGKDFLEEYYNYIEKIYNYQIPLRDIASKGKIKKTIEEYKKDCKTLTAAGRPKSRQAWMELAIKEDLKVNMGETIYFINIGKSKSQADCKKVKKFYRIDNSLFGNEKIYCNTEVEKAYRKYKKEHNGTTLTIDEYVSTFYKDVKTEDEILLNSKLLPLEMIESDEDFFCDSSFKYNVPKYIAQFNSRISPLLVCFSREIRNKILITNPSDRNYFTNEEAKLVSGQPNKPEDQDTYEQLMTMEDKEIKFWISHPEWEIPFLKECGMDWEKIKADYLERMEREKELGIDFVKEQYTKAIDALSSAEIEAFFNGTVPKSISVIVNYDSDSGIFYDKNYKDVKIGTSSDIYELYGMTDDIGEVEGDITEITNTINSEDDEIDEDEVEETEENEE